MFTFVRVGYEPEMYLEDYGIYYADTNEPFITNDYYKDEVKASHILISTVDENGKEFCPGIGALWCYH